MATLGKFDERFRASTRDCPYGIYAIINVDKPKIEGKMMTIKIDNPKIESFFKNEFKSDIEKFSEFILQNLEAYNQKKEFDIT